MRRGILKILVSTMAALGAMTSARADTTPPDRTKVGDTLKIMRVYGGADGESHIDWFELPDVGTNIPGERLQSRLFATDVEIGESQPGSFIDWHGVSTPRLLIILTGQLEIGLGDGSKHILKGGDMVLAADTTGRGHTSRSIGTEIVRALTVRLPKDNPLAPKLNPCPPGVPDSQCVAARQTAEAKAKAKAGTKK
jgi:hypothetical protein